jgi:competence protein ComEC
VAIGCLLSYFLPRRVAFFFTVIAIALFVTMVGGEASVVRAAFMGILLLLCQTVGRPHDSRNAIALAASVMVLANPTIIINDLGFILSFMSLLGIVYLSPALKYVLGMDAAAQSLSFLSWKENLVMTLSAQLAVLPIIVVSFGQFSLTAIIANMLVLPFIPITMAIGFALGAVSLLWAPLGFVFAKASQILLTYETSVMYLFGKLQVPIRGIFASRTAFIAYYIALVYIVWHSRKPPTQTCAPQKEQ